MIKYLQITNIVLVETAQINFKPGLNVLSGETGSGKSAIIHALSLITGDRADTGMIRHGEEKGIVEAIFDLTALPHLKELFEEAGIDYIEGEDLIIRREILSSGKSRAFVNNQAAHISFLRILSHHLLQMVSQHASQWLQTIDRHRQILDLFGDHEIALQKFSKNWELENGLRGELDTLVQNEAQRLREIEIYRREIDELQEAALKEGEEEALFAEYSLLSNAEELASKVHEINQLLTGERQPIIPQLNRQINTLKKLVEIDPSLSDVSQSYTNALLELQEVAHSLRNYQAGIENDPLRTSVVNERLSLINTLKKKYGSTLSEIQTYQASIELKLSQLENADVRIESLTKQLQEIAEENNELCAQITLLRKNSAKHLEQALVSQLRALNMPKVDFQIEIVSQKRNRFGDDRVEFYLVPNVGEQRVPIRDCASGGELSRLMLSMQTILAGKEKISTLVFDEIDANIGGETATIVGEKLKEIGQTHQVLCITHFPQVARRADHHIQISKKEIQGRTVTLVRELDHPERQKELSRMHGGTTQ
jgi:DNA repair protein RecN (Recombination protein N)